MKSSKNRIIHIEKEDQFDEYLASDIDYLFVDFYATWCGPCKRIEPELEKLCEEYNYVKFLKVDVDKQKNLAGYYNIKAMPTFLLFDKTNKSYKPITGANVEQIKALLATTQN